MFLPSSPLAVFALVLLVGGSGVRHRPAPAGSRVTILYDAFGNSPGMIKDWGYSALVEYGGKRILFDTGNNPETFARNVEQAGADLGSLDFVVISHRHLDHTAGLDYLLRVNPGVRIYAPKECSGVPSPGRSIGVRRRCRRRCDTTTGTRTTP